MKGFVEKRALEFLRSGSRAKNPTGKGDGFHFGVQKEGIQLEPALMMGKSILVTKNIPPVREGMGRKEGTLLALKLLEGLGKRGYVFLDEIREPFRLFFLDVDTGDFLLARSPDDPKPLYFSAHGQSLAFGTTPKEVLQLKGVNPEHDPAVIPEYLVFQDIAGTKTLFKHMRSVPPGVLIRGKLGTEELEERSLWSGWLNRILKEPLEDPREALFSSLEAAVGEVRGKIGLFLSSGVDSSLIAWGLKEMGLGEVQAITVTCPGYKYDEGKEAGDLSKELGIPWSPLVFDASLFSREWKEAVSHLLMPMVSTNQIPWWVMCKEARKRGFEICLSGEGCDSWISGGHNEKELQELEEAKSSGREHVAMKAVFAKAHILNDPGKIGEIMEVPLDLSERIATFLDCMEALPQGSIRDVALLYHVRTNGRRLLERASLTAMAHGIDLRLPFIQRGFLRFAASLPWERKNKSGIAKSPLKELCTKALGEKIPSRRKVGFTFPLRTWIRDSEDSSLAALREMLSDSKIPERPIYKGTILKELELRMNGTLRPADWLLWSILNLELWLREIESWGPLGPLPLPS